MYTDDVSVRFSVTFDYKTYYSEEELAQEGGGLAVRVAGVPEIEGALEITWRDIHIKLSDQLAPWVQNLCYLAIPELAQAQNVVVSYILMSGVLKLCCEEEWIELSSEHFETVRLPRLPLLNSLVKCGHRFENFVAKVKQGDENYLAQLVDFPQFRQAARYALDATS